MITQVDVSRLPSYQWGREDFLNELKALLAETDSVLQEKESLFEQPLFEQPLQWKEQQTLKVIKLARLIKGKYLSGCLDTAQLADFWKMPEDEVIALLRNN